MAQHPTISLMDNLTKHRAQIESERSRKKLSAYARELWREWKRLDLPLEEERLIVAVSGGADSTALLLGLDELNKAGRVQLHLTVAHLNHGLRGKVSEQDAQWVEQLAKTLGFECVVGHARVEQRAAEAKDNLEQAARRARYEFFAQVAWQRGARWVLTAHTMDDQAETILLRLLRGSAAEGLSGIKTVRQLCETNEALLARPLIRWARREENEKYCAKRGVAFRIDVMNEDERFARARVRARLLPLMRNFNSRIVETLTRTADLLREDAEALSDAAHELLAAAACQDEVKGETSASPALRVNVLREAPAAVRRRALRLWIASLRGDLRRIDAVHLAGIDKLIEGERGGRLALLPGGSFIERRRNQLRFHAKKVEKERVAR